jgi:hemerythrin-like domain-containing protein
MTPGSDLKADHRRIRKLQTVLRVTAAAIAQQKEVPVSDLRDAIDIMNLYVDSYHHVKEEVGLFPVVQRGHRGQQRVIYGFLVEHEFGRRAARMIDRECARWEKGVGEAAEPLSRFLITYADFLEEHTKKENVWFVEVDEKLLSQGEQKEVMRRFSEVAGRALEPATQSLLSLKRLSVKYRK